VFLYPLAWARWQLWPGISWLTVAATALFFFLFELSYEVIYDLRDAPGDARAEVRTYPVVHGERGAARIIDGLCAASLVVLVAAWLAGAVPWRICILAVGPLLQLFLYKRILKRGITSADCINLTWLGAALLVAYHGWVLGGLPGVR
jgi:4-hydroxybenzoate polyprenyltransferase